MDQPAFKFHPKVLYIPLGAVLLIWLIYFIEIKFGLNFNKYGVFPQQLSGLKGIVFSPFIHSSANHLVSNSVPLFVMLVSLYYFYQNIATRVVVVGLLLTGLLTWFFARPAYHIGASGLVYLLVSFVFFSGVFRKHYRLVALSLAVVFLYGSMVWYIFPIEDRISWEGHLSGFLVGLAFAFIFRKKGPQPEFFEYSENKEFDQLFDEEGNFNPPVPEEIEEVRDKKE